MPKNRIHHALALACALLFSPALAQLSAWADRDLMRTRLEGLAELGLKALYLRCCDESEQRLLGLDEAAICSMTAEVLKQRSFGGNFDALLAWWRQQRGRARTGQAATER